MDTIILKFGSHRVLDVEEPHEDLWFLGMNGLIIIAKIYFIFCPGFDISDPKVTSGRLELFSQNPDDAVHLHTNPE